MKKWVVRFSLALVLLATSWTLLRPGFFRVHDFIHAARIAEMTRGLQAGHFPVRWSENFGFGYGMPLFEFYAPLPLYVGSVFYRLGLPMIPTIKMLFFICNLGSIVGAYLLGKKLFGRTGGILTAAGFGLAPYRAVNLYVRGALSEAWGVMAMPWILLGIVCLIDQYLKTPNKTKQQIHFQLNSGWLYLVGGLIILLLSHNLTTVIFLPMTILFGAAYLSWKVMHDQKPILTGLKPILALAWGYLLSIGATAFYLFPALLHNTDTKINEIIEGYFHYSQHFLYVRQLITPGWSYGGSGWGPNDTLSFFLGVGQWLAIYSLLGAAGRHFWKQRKAGWLNIVVSRHYFWFMTLGTLTAFSLFMTLLKSKPLWDLVPVYGYIQFPWRWLGTAGLFIGLLAGSITIFMVSRLKKIIISSALFLVLLGNAWYFRPEKMSPDNEDLYYVDATRISTEMSKILPDYIPLQMSDELEPPAEIFEPEKGEFVEPPTILVDRVHEKLVAVTLTSPMDVVFNVADFPGWKIYLDGQDVTHLKQHGPVGQIGIELPAGSHQVGIQYSRNPVRLWSDLVSLASWLIIGVALLNTQIKPRMLNSGSLSNRQPKRA